MIGHRMDPDETVVPENGLAHAIGSLRLSEGERWMASGALAKGEAISSLVWSAARSLRSAATAATRLLAPAGPASDQTQA